MAGTTLINDCFAHDRDRLSHQEALDIMRERLSPVAGRTDLPLSSSAGRILSDDITSPIAVPRFDNSAVDGYAFRHTDLLETGGWFPVSTRIAAGHRATKPLAIQSAARIFTGAIMPDRADSVAMQEDCETHEQDGKAFVIVPTDLKPGANCRRAGEDLAQGDLIASAGRALRPQDAAALASVGKSVVPVYDKLTIALVSTGDEIVRPGEPNDDGEKIYDANFILLKALLKTLPADVFDAGIWPDDAEIVSERLAALAASADVILTTGGASKGEADYLTEALETLGQRHVWQLAIKPGRPVSFGQIGNCPVFALPGNPVAAFVCFALYVRPALLRLGGSEWQEPRRLTLPSGFAMPAKKPDRREFLRGRLARGAEGELIVERFPQDGSGIISSLREADGLIELPEALTEIQVGAPVDFIPFTEFGIS